jgi:hypothetical protein
MKGQCICANLGISRASPSSFPSIFFHLNHPFTHAHVQQFTGPCQGQATETLFRGRSELLVEVTRILRGCGARFATSTDYLRSDGPATAASASSNGYMGEGSGMPGDGGQVLLVSPRGTPLPL